MVAVAEMERRGSFGDLRWKFEKVGSHLRLFPGASFGRMKKKKGSKR